MFIAPDNPNLVASDDGFPAKVVKVFDGDGFLANVWDSSRATWVPRIPFRFAFIDAPEMEQPFGSDSKDFLSRLIAGKTMRLDPVGKESTGGVPIDPYKRILCVGYLTEQMEIGPISYYMNGSCHVGSLKSVRLATRNIELEMIVNGWAWVLEQYSFERQAEYFEAQDDARRHRRGLWAMDRPEAPWTFKRRQKRRARANEGQGKLL